MVMKMRVSKGGKYQIERCYRLKGMIVSLDAEVN